MGIISLDTETTGLDFEHGTRPYLVTIAREDGEQAYWEWEVDPETRMPDVIQSDLEEIQTEIDAADLLLLHNPVFDVRALQKVYNGNLRWPWEKTRCTVISGHLLNSKLPKNLTSQVLHWLGYDLDPLERKIEKVTKEAQSVARRDYPSIRVAKAGLPDMPSAKEKVWKFDMWLPKALCLLGEGGADWETAGLDYALGDTMATMALYLRHWEEIERRNLEAIYLDRLDLLRINYDLEQVGVSINRRRKDQLCKEYKIESLKAGHACKKIAKRYGHDLELPKNGVNNSLRELVFDRMGFPSVIVSKKTKKPSLNREALAIYADTLEGDQLEFVQNLASKRSRDTAIQYMEGYERFWRPVDLSREEWFQLFPSLNPCGTDTLRWSSSNPNEQNISKKKGFNLRYCFGPLPGREWWSLDYDNLELRIPGYECEEPAMLEIFERPNEPPYYGSYHLLIFSILHPDKYDRDDPEGLIKARDLYKSTWYQRTKNGNFAELYGAIERADGYGTADRAFGIRGAQAIIAKRLSRKAALNQSWISFAERRGYVETMPDAEVDPNRGYPLQCTRDDYGRVLKTVPLNYHVQGTACWVIARAMAKIQKLFDKLGGDYRMIMNVHDEIVFDFPFKPNYGNRPIIRKAKYIMEGMGNNIGVPLTCGVTYHPETWAVGKELAV